MIYYYFQDKKLSSRETLMNPASSQDLLSKSSQLDVSNPSTSRRHCVPKIQLTYDSDDFEDIDGDEESLNKKKKKSRHRSTLRKRRTASLPVLYRNSSFSSEDSEKITKICIHDKREAMSIFSKILSMDYQTSEGTESDNVIPLVKIRKDGAFRRSLRIPAKFFNQIKVLPTEEEIENQTEPPDLFTKLDIASRLIFPMAFVSITLMYSLYFTYLPNEWEEDDL